MLVGHFTEKVGKIENFNFANSSRDIKLLIQANYTCNVCGFKSQPSKHIPTGYMVALHEKSGPNVYCALCAGGRLLNSDNNGQELGKLIYSSQLSQKNVSDLFRICSGIIKIGVSSMPLSSIERAKETLNQLFESQMMVDASVNPFFEGDLGSTRSLGRLLLYCGDETRTQYHKLVENVRFLPNPNVYSDVISYYIQANPKVFEL